MKRVIATLLLISYATFNCAGKLTSESLHSGQVVRNYKLYVPDNLTDNRPLVFALHGALLSADNMLDNAFQEWLPIADAENWLIVLPNGVGRYWNDCRADSDINIGVDDVGFLDAMITDLQEKYKINTEQIYISGVSNGGMMAFRMAQESKYPIAAIATVIANIPKNDECMPIQRKVSWLAINGTADKTMPFKGGFVSNRDTSGEVYSLLDSFNLWAKSLNIESHAYWQKIANTHIADNSTVIKLSWNSADAKQGIALYIINEGGHITPSATHPVAAWVRLFNGNQNRDIEPTYLMRDFFKKYP